MPRTKGGLTLSDDEPAGRKTPVTQKVSRREDRAIRTVAEIKDMPVSSLLHHYGVRELVRLYEQFIAQARKAS
jgi:hypothetical protein